MIASLLDSLALVARPSHVTPVDSQWKTPVDNGKHTDAAILGPQLKTAPTGAGNTESEPRHTNLTDTTGGDGL